VVDTDIGAVPDIEVAADTAAVPDIEVAADTEAVADTAAEADTGVAVDTEAVPDTESEPAVAEAAQAVEAAVPDTESEPVVAVAAQVEEAVPKDTRLRLSVDRGNGWVFPELPVREQLPVPAHILVPGTEFQTTLGREPEQEQEQLFLEAAVSNWLVASQL
jgi:hypothetical protein